MRLKFILIILALISIFFFGIYQSPMQKLKSDTVFNDLDMPFWAKQENGKTTLWSKATSYCGSHDQKPNCGPVLQVLVITNGSTVIPAYGSSGHNLTTPSFN